MVGVLRLSVGMWSLVFGIAALVLRHIPTLILRPVVESGGMSPVSRPVLLLTDALSMASQLCLVVCGALVAVMIARASGRRADGSSGPAAPVGPVLDEEESGLDG
ncbi:hypothetical protein M3T53_09275 [Actinomyces sp. B33]|uniref:hypothetical protein n=1 Tax=Actinomyces sp. B33 TaxID=2942131 RepID=UPI002340AC96|nr:hypothetical protein [Actinomyces sp. B33]MDC4233888.1 hypothetical protein [Actinomyces sp. B33]